jgi:5-methylcytosine-specific restriction endonuclease McrA
MSEAAVIALALLLPPSALVLSAFSSPGGMLPLLFPRRWRWWYRRHRKRGVRGSQRSGRVGTHLREMVERADRHRCVACGATRATMSEHSQRTRLQVDHIVPWIMGGLTCLWNCALLCRSCNMIKSAYWVAPGGRVYYRRGYRAPHAAAEILAAERRARHSPARWLRAYGLLPSW